MTEVYLGPHEEQKQIMHQGFIMGPGQLLNPPENSTSSLIKGPPPPSLLCKLSVAVYHHKVTNKVSARLCLFSEVRIFFQAYKVEDKNVDLHGYGLN